MVVIQQITAHDTIYCFATILCFAANLVRNHMRGSREGENYKAIGFLIITGPDPMENHKATKPAFNVGPPSARQRNTKRHFNGVSLMSR